MTETPLTSNLHLLIPEFLLAIFGLAVLTIDLILPSHKKMVAAYTSVAGLVIVLLISLLVYTNSDTHSLYGGLIIIDNYSIFFRNFFLILGIVIVVSSIGFASNNLENKGEYFGIILFSILAMNLMAASAELLTAYISLELMSFCFYILVSYSTSDAKSNEAGIKYVLIGAFSSAILLFGVSMMYGSIGVTSFSDINSALSDPSNLDSTLWVGLALIVVGIGFKLAIVPFHMWAPDVYEGAPLPITAYLSVGSKAAVFALVLRFFAEALMPVIDVWQIIIAVLAVLTMTIGNLVAIAQHNIKRLLAYSSIGQVGFLLIGLSALSQLGSTGLILHLVGYAFASMTIFIGVIAFFNATGKDNIVDLSGLADRHPLIAASIAIGLFSSAGLPIFAGFTTKFYLLVAATQQDLLWLAVIAIINSLISLYYYLKIIRQMYIEPISTSTATSNSNIYRLKVSRLLIGMISAMVVGTIFVGVYPFPIVEILDTASLAILN